MILHLLIFGVCVFWRSQLYFAWVCMYISMYINILDWTASPVHRVCVFLGYFLCVYTTELDGSRACKGAPLFLTQVYFFSKERPLLNNTRSPFFGPGRDHGRYIISGTFQTKSHTHGLTIATPLIFSLAIFICQRCDFRFAMEIELGTGIAQSQ